METFQNAPHIHLPEVDSTNNYASKLLKLPNTRNKTAITTDLQIEGKGQRGKTWISEARQNFLGTFIIQTQLKAQSIFMLSKWVSWNICQVIQKYEITSATIKWPNDIYVDNKKSGGILIENHWQGNELTASLVGIGININNSPQALDQPTTHLQLHSKRKISANLFFQDLKASFDDSWHLLQPEHNKTLDSLYHNELCGGDNEITTWLIPSSNLVIQAKILKVHSDGAIELELENEERKKYYHGEIFKK